MNEKYDLKAMLKEIEKDEMSISKPKNEQVSQDAISNLIQKKKGNVKYEK